MTKSHRATTAFASVVCLLVSASALCETTPPEAGNRSSSLTLESSDVKLTQAFDWAKRQALAYSFSDSSLGHWYEAALPGREAFCMRDVAHQSMGAHALGLSGSTYNMLRRFAESISESRDWCSYWEIDRHNRPAPVDYKNDAEFWYNLPANFDVLDACYRMYEWTGNLAYLEDPALLNFYDRTVNDYVARWDLGPDHIMKRSRWMNVRGPLDLAAKFNFYRGDPSYTENQDGFVAGVDLLAVQYAAYLDYSRIQELRANSTAAAEYRQKAQAVKKLINETWWNEHDHQFYATLSKDHRLEGHAGLQLLYRDAAEPGLKTSAALDDLLRAIKQDPSSAVEDQSHHAEVLYRYGASDVAYQQMLDLARPGRDRREYPEVSYSVIGAIVTGAMGIAVQSAPMSEAAQNGQFVDRAVRTLPALGSQTAWAELRNLPIRANTVAVRHEGNRLTTFTNTRGPALIWQPSFVGKFGVLLVDGHRIQARSGKDRSGREISWVRVTVGAGNSVRVEVPASPGATAERQ